MRRIIVGITGATGAIFGIRLLQALRAAEVETHLVVSKWGLQTIEHEMGILAEQLRELASVSHGTGNMAATVSSGSFFTDGMVIAPCSMRTLARMGVTMLPPMPAFYNRPQTIDDIVDHIVARVLDQFGIAADFAKRWDGQLARPDSVKRVK